MQRFGGDRIKTVMSWTGMDEDTPIENKLITKSIGGAQVKVESYHFDIRKHLLDYDDVLNKQREVIYADRAEILRGENLSPRIVDMVRQELLDLARKYLPDRHADDWDVPGLLSELSTICPLPEQLSNENAVYQHSQDEVHRILSEHAGKVYEDREAEIGSEQMRTLERLLLLRAIDTHWVAHLTTMENLRTGIGLVAYGQRNPLDAYRTEGHQMFQELTQRMQYDVVRTLFHVTLTEQPASGSRAARPQVVKTGSPMEAVTAKSRDAVPVGAGKVGRNTPCPCGSGKKYKRCHGGNV